jgi:zona occludens toxin (predicted ATPase)
MNAFDLALYAAAIIAVLWLRAEPTTEATPAPATTEPTAEPIEPAATVTAEPTEPATPEPATEPTAEPATVTPAPDLQALTVTELRRLATAARYPWRNHHGRNRHATKRELIAALS